jgi:hypothetical protein
MNQGKGPGVRFQAPGLCMLAAAVTLPDVPRLALTYHILCRSVKRKIRVSGNHASRSSLFVFDQKPRGFRLSANQLGTCSVTTKSFFTVRFRSRNARLADEILTVRFLFGHNRLTGKSMKASTGTPLSPIKSSTTAR